MSKFLKISTIIGIVLILIGTGASAAAFAMGANLITLNDLFKERFEERFDRYVDSVYDEEFHYNVSAEEEKVGVNLSSDGISVDLGEQGGVKIDRNGVNVDLGEEGAVKIDRNGIRVREGAAVGGNSSAASTGGWHAEYPSLTEFELTQNGGKVSLLWVEGIESFTIDGTQGDISSTDYSEDEDGNQLELRVFAGDEYTIRVPIDWTLEKVEATIVGGVFDSQRLNAVETEIYVGNAEASFVQQYGETVELECRGGVLRWSQGEDGEPVWSLDVESQDQAAVYLTTAGADGWKSYSYKLENEGGVIRTPEFEMNAVSREKKHLKNLESTGSAVIETRSGGSVIIENR